MASNIAKSLLNSLYDWSIDSEAVLADIDQRSFKEYVAWKVPVPANLLENEAGNRGFRAFCVGCVLTKLRLLADVANHALPKSPDHRTYCILTKPNLFGSEVGFVFSEEKWQKLLFRNIDQGSYREKTETVDLPLSSDFGIYLPEWASSQYMKHTIEDSDEEISFRGGFHVIWSNAPTST